MKNVAFGLALTLLLLGLTVPAGTVSAQAWTGIHYSATSTEIYCMLYTIESGYPTSFAGFVKLYIDSNYIGLYSISTGGTWIAVPEAYQISGTHTFTLVFEGDSTHLPATASGTYSVGGSEEVDALDRTHILINGSEHVFNQFATSVSDFNGYWFSFDNVTWQNYRNWWEFETTNDLNIRINITASGKTLLAVTNLHGSTSLFGALNTFHVSVGASSNASSWGQVTLITPTFVAYGIDLTGWNPEEFQLYMIPESNQTRLMWFWNVGGKYVAYTIICPVVLDGNAIVTLEYEHEGNGFIEGYVSDSFTLPASPPYEDFQTGTAGWISQVLGIDLGQAAAILSGIVVIFFAVVKLTIPLLGAIVFFWIMDTIFTAITTGEIRLIGDMFMRIYEILLAIWRTLVAIIEAIWDLITFWS